MSKRSRREFLELAASSVGTAGLAACGLAPELRDGVSSAAEDTGDTGWSDTAIATPSCEETLGAPEGPYYIAEAPALVDMRTKGETGTTLHLSGTVRSALDCTLLAGATVEIWHADQEGDYDLDTSTMYYRTKLTTGFDGTYRIVTLLPPSYLISGGMQPQHLHVKVVASRHRSLITQLRFEGDPYADEIVDESLQMPVTIESDGSYTCMFDFILRRA